MRGSAGAISQDEVLQVKISLLEVSEPPVWRRPLVLADIRLDRMHQVIQQAMGWEDDHLVRLLGWLVEVLVARFGLGDQGRAQHDARRPARGAGGRAGYVYDFGDDWKHELVLERTLLAESGTRYQLCVAGEGACPPEDCGGVWGYMELRDALADPGHERHDESLEWLGLQTAAGFDPARFDVDEVNRALARGDAVARPSGFGSEGVRAMAVELAT